MILEMSWWVKIRADMVGLPKLQGREPEDRERVLAREDRKGDRQILQAESCTLSPLKYIPELFLDNFFIICIGIVFIR